MTSDSTRVGCFCGMLILLVCAASTVFTLFCIIRAIVG